MSDPVGLHVIPPSEYRAPDDPTNSICEPIRDRGAASGAGARGLIYLSAQRGWASTLFVVGETP